MRSIAHLIFPFVHPRQQKTRPCAGSLRVGGRGHHPTPQLPLRPCPQVPGIIVPAPRRIDTTIRGIVLSFIVDHDAIGAEKLSGHENRL